MILTSLTITPEAFAERTGWVIKVEGACKAERCVPLPAMPPLFHVMALVMVQSPAPSSVPPTSVNLPLIDEAAASVNAPAERVRSA